MATSNQTSPGGGQSPPNPVNILDSQHLTVPLFIVLQAGNQELKNMSPFLINKYITIAAGVVKNIRKQQSGDLLVEAANEKQAKAILNIKSFGNTQVKAFGHKSLNYSKGVIFCPELSMVSEDELKTELNSQNVCDAHRIVNRKNGQMINTNLIILTFNVPNMPKEIKAGYLKLNVRPYVPNPLRCFRCQKFGHSKTSCRSKQEICAKCSEPNHDSNTCSNKDCCANCQGNHPSYSRQCPKFKFEKEVQTVKVNNNISFPEARKIVESRLPRPNTSYSSITQVNTGTTTPPQTKTSEIATQTSKVNDPSLKVIIPTKYKQISNKTTQANQIQIPKIFQFDTTQSTDTASTSKSNEKTIIKNVKHIKTNPKQLVSKKKEKDLPKVKAYTASMFLKKPKVDKEKDVLKLHVSSDDNLSDYAEDGDMQVEKGMEVLPHLKNRS